MFKAALRRKPSPRRLRLYGVATCRRFWKRLPGAATRQLIEKVEAFADDEATWHEVAMQRDLAQQLLRAKPLTAIPRVKSLEDLPPLKFWHLAVYTASRRLDEVSMAYLDLAQLRPDLRGEPDPEQADITRCIFGGLIRKAKFSKAWRTSTAVGLARTMYDSRDFGAMPILADALEEAGCDSPDVLAHCRDPDGVHVRGGWVVDLVLGKS